MVDESTALDVQDPPWQLSPTFKRLNRWNRIDWARIGRAVEFYEKKGHTYIEVPWYVDEKFVKATYPFMHSFKTESGDLVGSAEQSLLSLSAEGKLPRGRDSRFVAVSPCFRDNQPDDEYHNPTFMKVELYRPGSNLRDVWRDVQNAAEFFASEGAVPEIVKTDEGWDINVGGVEVGSYGFREVYDHRWVYGTGLAEPRFSQTLINQGLHIMEKLDGEW